MPVLTYAAGFLRHGFANCFLELVDMAQVSGHYKFAICVTSEGCDDLQVWKLYRLLPDVKAEVENYLRVVDDSGEDYLYPACRSVVVKASICSAG